MSPIASVTPAFVEFVPESMAEGTLYISRCFETAIHLCACGCGHETVTPLSGGGWRLIEDGGLVSLEPSIGNFNFPCRSHYFIRLNRVVWWS